MWPWFVGGRGFLGMQDGLQVPMPGFWIAMAAAGALVAAAILEHHSQPSGLPLILAALVEEFGSARPQGLAGDDLAEVTRAVVAGRVATLLIEARREIPGRIDAATGAIELDDLDHPEVDDLLDDVGVLAMRMGGQVVVVPSERMPTETGIAAIYRY